MYFIGHQHSPDLHSIEYVFTQPLHHGQDVILGQCFKWSKTSLCSERVDLPQGRSRNTHALHAEHISRRNMAATDMRIYR